MIVALALGVLAASGEPPIVVLYAMVAGLLAMSPQPPLRKEGVAQLSIRASIAEGLRFVRGEQALKGSFAIDLAAMTFGMPRALFAVLAISVYDAGAEGTGLLYAAVAAGATVAALTTSLWFAAGCLALAGTADSVSAVCRSTINQTVTPDAMRGRMSSVFSLVVTSGPRLGDVESGAVAALTSARFSVVSGGVATIAAVGLIVLAFPALAAYDEEPGEAPTAPGTSAP